MAVRNGDSDDEVVRDGYKYLQMNGLGADDPAPALPIALQMEFGFATIATCQEPDLLRRVFATDTPVLTAAALKNEFCPPEIVVEFRQWLEAYVGSEVFGDARTRYLVALASRQDNSEQDWRVLMRTSSEAVVLAMAGNPHAPAYVLRWALRFPSSRPLALLVRNHAFPLDDVFALLRDLNSENYRVHFLLVLQVLLWERNDVSNWRDHIEQICYTTGMAEPELLYALRQIEYHSRGPMRREVADILLHATVKAYVTDYGAYRDDLLWIALHSCLADDRQPVSPHVVNECLEFMLASRHLEQDASGMGMVRVVSRLFLPRRECRADVLEAACRNSNVLVRTAAAENPNCTDIGRTYAFLLGLGESV